ncbi:hypothetical protein LINPERPRIM_LOCUS39503 [Linum perenne]
MFGAPSQPPQLFTREPCLTSISNSMAFTAEMVTPWVLCVPSLLVLVRTTNHYLLTGCMCISIVVFMIVDIVAFKLL